MTSAPEDQGPEAICMGCTNVIEEGSVVAFGESLFHLECFVCAKCSSPVDCESNLLLLTDGRPVCENCSYNCHICKQTIRDEAIMTGEEAYHADCFKCILCKKKIEDLVFTQTTKGIFCTTCHEQRKLDKQKRKEERQRLQQSNKPPSPSGYVDKTLPSLPADYPGARGQSRRDLMQKAGNRHASRMFDVQVVNDYMASISPSGGASKSQGRNPLDTRPRNESLDIPRRRYNEPYEPRRPSPPLRSNSEPSDSQFLSTSPDPMPSKTDPLPTQLAGISDTSSLLSSILITNNSSTSLLDSSPETTPTSSFIGSSVKSDEKSTMENLSLEIPPMNFSFFETESDELANLTKLLGTSIQLNANDETSNSETDTFHHDHKPPTPPPASSDRISTDFTNFPQPPVSVPRKSSNASLLSSVSSEVDSQTLRAQLKASNAKLVETENNLNKIKTVSRRALDEFTRAKEEFAKEVAARQQTEVANRQLRAQLAAFQQASILGSDSFLKAAREEIMRLSNLRGELEKSCNDLKAYRESVSADLDDMVKKKQAGLLSSANPILHLERKQQALFAAIKSMTAERDVILKETQRLEKTRDEVINEMVMLNTKNAELTSLNNDLSRRVTEREREAAAVMAGTSFLGPQLTPSKSNDGLNSSTSPPRRKSSDSHTHAGAVRRIVQRDSFNGTQAPKMFRLKRAKEDAGKMFGKLAGSGKGGKYDPSSTGIYNGLNGASSSSVNLVPQHQPRKDSRNPQRSQESSLQSLAQGSHTFQQTSFLRPVKCDVCCEKMWGLNEMRCQACGFLTHMKCISHVPQYCLGLHTNGEGASGGDNDAAYAKGGSLFGNDLTKQVEAEGRTIPLLVDRCIAAVELRGMDYEGIYRKSGGAAQMRSIQLSFEQGLDPDLTDDDEYNDICAVTSILKQYLRELPNPLMTYELYPQFLESISMAPGEEKAQKFSSLFSQLPTANYDTLKALFTHLNNVREQSDENLMTAKNLAVVFGPTLLRDQDSSRDLLDMNAKNATVEYIISNTTTLFSSQEDSS
ncbi:hypothetical protein K450DRAFT_226868 [Umbelopsis ramanniana AG]|uniref:RhoGAP-domain-containing protein n=1 Tax=Umbelopsis ramanniana AG TaxID=1314678 RepID=A0AAD5EF78_UMBRA|nr:uncharacterized protein K450DRAFT_226868 [Umbelopsis ramanniana AG]KAI8582778.1 hypothetical protein K450DRAFT_226868 [Umbelopsis ramanniana AG]